MYLNGKVFLRIDKFDQDRKFIVFSGMCSGDFFSFHKDVLKESVSFVLSTVHVAWARRVTEKFPGFCQNISVIFFSVLCLELCAAPEIIRSSRYIRYRMYPSQNSGRAAFPHPALYETHYSTIIRKY